MIRKPLLLAAASLALTTGCVPVEKYRAAKMEAESYQEQLSKAQSDVLAAQQKAESAQKQLDALNSNGNNAMGLVGNLQQQLAAKQAQLDDMNKRYAEAVAKAGSSQALPAPLTSELSALAAANPDTIEFDQQRGIVKFRSDVTFALGETAIQPAAKDVLTKFATILNSQAASAYEMLIAGHTDSTPVSNPATIKAGNKDNWYLSAHRAISVAEVLVGQKVNPQRIGVVGYADQRPAASNGTEQGRKANRRVEVLILPQQVRSTAPMSAAPSAPKPAPKMEMNKDSGGPSPAPAPMTNDNK